MLIRILNVSLFVSAFQERIAVAKSIHERTTQLHCVASEAMADRLAPRRSALRRAMLMMLIILMNLYGF